MPLLAPFQTLVHDLKKNDIIPEVVPEDFVPYVHLDVSYPGENGQRKGVDPGCILTKADAATEPQVAFIGTDAEVRPLFLD